MIIPFGDRAAGAALLAQIDADRGQLAGRARTAWPAARENSSDAWYRRAEWTLKAHKARLAAIHA